jgi:dihydrolipoamide dehydrogenase
MPDYDLIVIGAGPGGYVAAIRAAQLGGKVAIVEREELGGVCLNWGCIPTKTMIHTAELYRKLQHAKDYGLVVDGLQVDLKALKKRKNDVVRRNKNGVKSLLKANKIEVHAGDAVVTAPGEVSVGGKRLTATSIIIATGSAPAQIPGLETNGTTIITSTEALELESLPERIAVIGAGAIGAEFACIWNALGANVTLIELLPAVLPLEDEELSQHLEHHFIKKLGMDVRTGTTVERIEPDGEALRLHLRGAKAGTLDVDLVLVGIGRKYLSEVVSAAPELGVELGPKGQILVNDRMETNVPGIFAIGDVTGKTMLAHGASAEGLVAVANALGGSKRMDYRVVPACTFTSPEVASVGLTEREAREAGREVKIGRFPFLSSGRAQSMGATEGMVKIVGDAATDEVLGVHIMGAEAGELIAAAAVAMAMEATVAEIAHTIHTHPTLSEAVMEAAENYLGRGIHSAPKS